MNYYNIAATDELARRQHEAQVSLNRLLGWLLLVFGLIVVLYTTGCIASKSTQATTKHTRPAWKRTSMRNDYRGEQAEPGRF